MRRDAQEPWQARCYARLIEGHGLRVLRYLQGMLGAAEEAEDLAQDVFLRAWSGLPNLQDEAHARSWFYTIAINTARSHLRDRSRRATESLDAQAAEPVDPVAAIDELLPAALAVRRALATLKEDDREILLMVGLVGFTSVEAAALLEIEVEAARKRWQRACKRFETALEEPE